MSEQSDQVIVKDSREDELEDDTLESILGDTSEKFADEQDNDHDLLEMELDATETDSLDDLVDMDDFDLDMDIDDGDSDLAY